MKIEPQKVEDCLKTLYSLYQENWKISCNSKNEYSRAVIGARAKAYKNAHDYIKKKLVG